MGLAVLFLGVLLIQFADCGQAMQGAAEPEQAKTGGTDLFGSDGSSDSKPESSTKVADWSDANSGSLQYPLSGSSSGSFSGPFSASSSLGDIKTAEYPRNQPCGVPGAAPEEDPTSTASLGILANQKFIGFGTALGGLVGAGVGFALQDRLHQSREAFTIYRTYKNRLGCDSAEDCMQRTITEHLVDTSDVNRQIFLQIIERALKPGDFAQSLIDDPESSSELSPLTTAQEAERATKIKEDVEKAAKRVADLFVPVVPSEDGTWPVTTTMEIEAKILEALDWTPPSFPASILVRELLPPGTNAEQLLREIKRVYYRIM